MFVKTTVTRQAHIRKRCALRRVNGVHGRMRIVNSAWLYSAKWWNNNAAGSGLYSQNKARAQSACLSSFQIMRLKEDLLRTEWTPVV